ncbi:DUF805 domain-containing protein [Rodentibacter trehalosifermentans]|uniref:DUF805 domain-containing protein n=1 Tax=Rodentibacter trehalosifermentans TaxID=1908263 RepID=UPI000986B04C|nr:DUF805 domain-containing protein [Rodentibacter trehalosifermentans]OOF45956.1 hypothetical protein BKK53_12075 [Rodentibacter trehalosifermentans]
MNGFQWFLTALNNTFKFSGRARRAEYAWFSLISIVILLPIEFLAAELSVGAYWFIYIVYMIPSISVTTRRLHDLGYSGWLQIPLGLLNVYLFIQPTTESALIGWSIMSFVVLTIIIYFASKDGQRKDNIYGKDPKGIIE